MPIVLTYVIYGADVWVIQCGSGFGLAPKAFQRGPIMFRFDREKLECHQTVEASVLGLVYHSHAAAANPLEYTIMGNNSA
jgi:hypothetical protein